MINFSGYEKPRGSVIRSASIPESARIPSYLFTLPNGTSLSQEQHSLCSFRVLDCLSEERSVLTKHLKRTDNKTQVILLPQKLKLA